MFRVYTHSSQDTCILILMFCTSLWQFKVNAGCICLTPVRRKLLFFEKNVHSRISGDNQAVFCLNFCSAGEGPILAIVFRPKICARGTIVWGRSEEHGPTSLGNLGGKSSEPSSPHFKTYFMRIKLLLYLDNNLKCLIPIILPVS